MTKVRNDASGSRPLLAVRGRRAAIACAVALVGGCLSPGRSEPAPSPVAATPDTTSTCPASAPDRCAIASPYQRAPGELGAAPHRVNLLDIGDDALLLRIHLIRAARESIDLQQFIWTFDRTGHLLFRELVRAARRGVQVRILGDHLATIRSASEMASAVLAHENLVIRVYNPTIERVEASSAALLWSGLTRFSLLNQRMHNKLLVIDGHIGLVGGRNHEDRYFDRDLEYAWLDRDIVVVGPVVREMESSFQSYWNSELAVPAERLLDVRERLAGGRAPRFDTDRAFPAGWEPLDRDASSYGEIRRRFWDRAFPIGGRVAFFADPPGKRARREPATVAPVRSGIIAVAREARETLVIETPYLVLSRDAVRALKRLRRRRPGLRIIASTNSLAATDHFMVYAITFKQKRMLLETLDFRIFELKPDPTDAAALIPRYPELAALAGGRDPREREVPVAGEGPVVGLHGKSLVVDERIALVGSHNFDPRSVEFDTQVAVAVWDERFARFLRARILRNTAPGNSWVVGKQREIPVWSFWAGVVARVSRALPVGDVWPFRYSACFALREGRAPVDAQHPDFYEHYENVGQFPTVELSPKAIQTRIFSALGGFATPLL